MHSFIVALLAIGVLSKRVDVLVDRGNFAPNNAIYLLATFLASWLGSANIIWAFLAIHWPFPVGGLVLGIALSFIPRRNDLASFIVVKPFMDAVIIISAFYLWIFLWPFHRGHHVGW